jgi:hypothetical protein
VNEQWYARKLFRHAGQEAISGSACWSDERSVSICSGVQHTVSGICHPGPQTSPRSCRTSSVVCRKVNGEQGHRKGAYSLGITIILTRQRLSKDPLLSAISTDCTDSGSSAWWHCFVVVSGLIEARKGKEGRLMMMISSLTPARSLAHHVPIQVRRPDSMKDASGNAT